MTILSRVLVHLRESLEEPVLAAAVYGGEDVPAYRQGWRNTKVAASERGPRVCGDEASADLGPHGQAFRVRCPDGGPFGFVDP